VTASEEFTKVPARAKQAKDRAAAAQNEAKDCFGQDVESAPASAQGRAESRRQTAHNHTETVSAENRAQRDEHDAVLRSCRPTQPSTKPSARCSTPLSRR
jgi:hypothetical protein